jgi:hypothetical protein
MSRFTGLLRRTSSRLDLPPAARSRVLLEMAADLEDTFEAYRSRGLDEEEAMRRVEERFDASDEALTELTRLHRSALLDRTAPLADQASTLGEKLMLVGVLLIVALLTGTLLLAPTFFQRSTPFLWSGAVIGIAALVLFLVKARRLFLGPLPAPRALRHRLPTLLFLACAACFNGVFGFFVTLFVSLMRIAADFERAAPHTVDWLLRSTTTMILSLLAAILAALLWFVLISKIRRIELREAARLVEDRP